MAKRRKLEPTGKDRAELRPLLAAAKADHDADGPRLAVADWLEENGDEADRARAEVIRLQLDSGSGGPDWSLCVAKLRDKWIRRWVGSQRKAFRAKLPKCVRGLLAAEASRAWLEGEPDADDWPWVEEAQLWTNAASGEVPRLLRSPRLASVPRIDLGGPLVEEPTLRATFAAVRDGAVRSVALVADRASFPALAEELPAELSELRFQAWWGGWTDWAALAQAEGAASLSSLLLGDSKLTDAGAALLAGGPWTNLRRLSVADTTLTGAGLASLTSFPLTRLEVIRSAFDGSALTRLAGSACQSSLEELRLNAGRAKAGGVPPVVPSLPRLRRLALQSCGLGADAVAAIARSSLLGQLDELDLSGNPCGAAGLAALLASGMPGPRTLLLSICGVGDAGVTRLAAWPGLARVRRLSIAACQVGDNGLRALADSAHATALEALEIDYNETATAAGVAYLLRSPACARLRWLSMVRMLKPRIAAAVEANAPPTLRELRRGTFRRGEIDHEGLTRLRAALPGCAIG